MERNIGYPAAMVDGVQVRVGWAQVDVIHADTQEVQAVIAGDARSAGELNIRHENGKLVVEQPQYGMLNFDSKWLQICLRVPQTWCGGIGLTTISGAVTLRGIRGTQITVETVSGAIHVDNVQCEQLTMYGISGGLQATRLTGKGLKIRSVSSAVALYATAFEEIRATTVSGRVMLDFLAPFRSLDMQTATGDVCIQLPGGRAEVGFRSVTGKLSAEGFSGGDGAPRIQVTTLSGNVSLADSATA